MRENIGPQPSCALIDCSCYLAQSSPYRYGGMLSIDVSISAAHILAVATTYAPEKTASAFNPRFAELLKMALNDFPVFYSNRTCQSTWKY